ncbi:MAG: hypothetical protein AB7K52_12250 [Phycisphaerales bacterium]
MNFSRASVLVLVLMAGSAVAVSGSPAAAHSGGERVQSGAAAARDGSEMLPIRRIALYRSGVGSFQREGTVTDAARIELRFDISQINDILKSLQLLDLDGGRIDSVSYPSKDPLSKRLSSFTVPIADAPSIPQLLGRLRGSVVSVKGLDPVTGTILAVETRHVPVAPGVPPMNVSYLSLVTSEGIRTIALDSISSFELEDRQLGEELNRALMAVAEARADRIKTLDLRVSGEGNRRIVARYVHETPVWKTSYRLVISDAPEQKERSGARVPDTLSLQGWAIVENTTDSDWKDVKLSLVSGRPVSFTMDLSEPLYLARPDVPVPTIPGVMPRNYAAGQAGGREDDRSAGEMRAPAAAPGAPPARGRAMGGAATEAWKFGNSQELSADDLTKYAPATQARAGEVGEVFFYEVTSPVTIERQRSAMIPFLGSNVEGRRVSIYNMNDRPDHPMRGIEVTNSSGMQLLPGPLAVFDGSAYAGDATINQVSPGDKRLLAYALDLDVAVSTTPEGGNDVTRVRIVDGLIEQTTKSVNALTYSFENKDRKRSRTIVVEHPRLAEWTLVTPEKPAEQTQDLYRFEVGAEAGKGAKLTVRQERVWSQTVEITSFDVPTIVRLSQQGRASPAVVSAIKKLAELQSQVNDLQKQVNDLKGQVATNTLEQERVSTTLQRVPRESEVYTDYMRELRDLNAGLKTLRENHRAKIAETEQKMKERDDFVRNLSVE